MATKLNGKDWSDVLLLAESLIFHGSGLGAARLFEDAALVPAEEQPVCSLSD